MVAGVLDAVRNAGALLDNQWYRGCRRSNGRRGVRGARETRVAEEPGTGDGAGETSAAQPRAPAFAGEPRDAGALSSVRDA